MARSEFQSIASEFGKFEMEYRDATCEKHGAYVESATTIGGVKRWGGCGKCIADREAQAARDEQDSMRRDARRSNLLSGWQGAEVPKRFANASF
jgi:DNA replication protein DnaC